MSEPIHEIAELDKLVHEPRRFAILNAAARAESIDYTFLRRITGLSQGNLATHLAKLEKAGLIELQKRFVMKRPRTRVVITEVGRRALEEHWRRLWELEERVEQWDVPETER